MNTAALHLLQQAVAGGVAAFGFGVLFNIGRKELLWCFAAGVVTLGVRTVGLDLRWSLEAASFVAAASVSACLLSVRPQGRAAGNMIALTGCIPMIPGAFVAKSILGLFALTAPQPAKATMTAIMSLEYLLRASFTICAIGAGLALPAHLIKRGRATTSCAEEDF